MIRLFVQLASNGTMYVPAPCRGTVMGAQAVWQTDAVDAADTIILSRGTTAVNTITAVDGDGLQTETGVPDTTNKGLIFDPDSSTKANTNIKLVANGAAGISLVTIEFDDSAYVKQTAIEA